MKSFAPDLFIVDKIPPGAGGELLPSLEWLKQNTACHCVLGLRDILDSPANVERDWQNMKCRNVIRKLYDAIWIYGDARLYDATTEYRFPEDICDKTTFTGLLDTRLRLERDPVEPAFDRTRPAKP